MRLQDSHANCGSTALHNALAALGIRRSPAECERLCGVTATTGVSPDGLIAAARSIRGLRPTVLVGREPTLATWALRGYLAHRPAILCVDDDEHYITAFGVLGDRFLVADGAHNDLVLAMTNAALVERWRPRDDELSSYWALVL